MTDFVNSKFPPVTTDQQRASAVSTTAEALAKVHVPSLAMGVSLADVATAMSSEARKQGITKLKLRGDNQLIRIEIEFDRQFTEADAGTDKDLAGTLRSLRPRVAGELVVYGGLKGAVATVENLSQIELRVLPSLSDLKVHKIELAGKYDLTAAGTAIAALLVKYKDNVSGELTRRPMTRVTVPAMSKETIDLNRTFQVANGSTRATIMASAYPVTIPFRLDSLAWLAGEDHLSAIVQLVPADAPPTQPAGQVEHTYAAIKERYDTQLKDGLAIADRDNNWVAIRKDVLALAMNSAVRQAGLCVTASADVPNQHMENQIKLPDGMGIDCSPTKACGQRECRFEGQHDTRNCSTCIIHKLFSGDCAQMGNDPFCEAAKAAQNLAYNTDANLRKADCDRLAAQEKLACEVEKSATKLLCEMKKEALNALARTGKFANLDVDASAKTSNMKVCLKDFTLSNTLDDLQFALDVQGSADVRINVKFVPLDIVGHLACVMDWSKDQTFNAALRESRVGIASKINLITDKDGARAEAKIGKIPVKARLQPGPTEFLMKSPDLMIKCPVLAGIAPMVVSASPFVPQLRGDIDYTLPEAQLLIKLDLPTQTVGDKKLNVSMRSTTQSLVLTGVIAK